MSSGHFTQRGIPRAEAGSQQMVNGRKFSSYILQFSANFLGFKKKKIKLIDSKYQDTNSNKWPVLDFSSLDRIQS